MQALIYCAWCGKKLESDQEIINHRCKEMSSNVMIQLDNIMKEFQANDRKSDPD